MASDDEESTMTTTTSPPGFSARLRQWVMRDTSGGLLLIVAALLGLIWANSPWREAFHALSSTVVGPHSLHLDLSLAKWAADGLLAIFFFTVGLELKHEFVAGSLRSFKQAAVPMIAAVGGMVVPAVVFVSIVLSMGDAASVKGWAIPTATDIAFAVAVLAIFGRGLPKALRLFLLTLAVVDDLLAITVIALFYTESINGMWLGVALAAVGAFALVVRTKRSPWWLLIPIAVVAWAAMHASGVHATVAGVLMGFTVPAVAIYGEHHARTHHYVERVAPWSNGLALPIFAFFSAGVTIVDGDAGAIVTQPVVIAIVVALVVGKLIGVMGTTAIVTKLTPLRLPDAIGIRDLLPVGLLTGIGFTVSLLIADLSFAAGSPESAGARLAVLIGTAIAAALAAVSLSLAAKRQRSTDENLDGIPDVDTAPITGDETAAD